MTAHPEPVGDDNRIKAALWFAAHGFGVFPCWSTLDGICRCPAGIACGSPGKHPITQNGFHDATTDPVRIRTFLSAGSRPNYGLVCPEGVFALDVDGDGWEARLAELEARHGALPPTYRTETRNGQHIFLRWPDGLPRPMKQMFGWVTRWGSGGTAGYVIGPRSIHASGFEYRPLGPYEIGTLPEAWAKAAVDEPAATIRIGGPVDPSTVGVGSRHDFLRDQARFMAGTIRDEDALFAALLAVNDKLSVPKTREEVRRAMGEALRKFPADPVDEQTGETVEHGDPGMLKHESVDSAFPSPPAAEAYGGLLGEVVAFLAKDTDASEVGILASLLAFCGALMPARGYLHAYHPSAPFFALVGKTGIGRKGTAMYKARDALANVLGMDAVNRARLNGIASGEGLVKALLDRERDSLTYGNPTGVLFEEEYANFLAAAGREGSTLDQRMRAAFDGMSMAQRKAAETVTVKEPYWLCGLVGITPKELQLKALAESFYSGSGNRWLWLPVIRRSRDSLDSAPPVLPAELAEPIRAGHLEAIRIPRLLDHDERVGRLLSQYDGFLREETIGIAADMSRRLGVIAFRIALIHASVERSDRVTVEHYRRGLALTEYARNGLPWTFGDAAGNRDAALLYRHLKDQLVLTNGTISKYIIRDIARRQAAIDELQDAGVAEVVKVRTGGRFRSELRLVAGSGDFRDFRALIGTEPTGPHPGSARESRESAREGSAEGAQKVRESARKLGWLRPCRDYRTHQGPAHRLLRDGWVCDRCDEEGPA